ncbi:condensation domain-containing protein, partial [Paenibacillus gorillae]|uniref:condensation domain-containing protein n=1 Tax=Paenibacillus gorillae TaxID=1243662 RepID=UPI0005A7A37F
IHSDIQQIGSFVQCGMDLSKGPLVRIVLFKTEGKGDYLLIAIHHLVSDAVSWRIIMEDFETGYKQSLQDEQIVLQDKTDSYQSWAESLLEFGKSKKLLHEIDYWVNVANTEVDKLPRDFVIHDRDRKVNNMNVIEMELEKEETNLLLKKVVGTFNIEINDILLTVLGMAIKDWCGIDKISINLEGHGREND